MNSCDNFFNYLRSKNLKYPVETVENFLLSIKAKPFIILSGSSGTGKTKLAQAYGDYIEGEKTILNKAVLKTAINNSGDRGSLSLNGREKLFNYLPGLSESEKEYYFTIGNVRSKGKLTLTPRIMSITENKNEMLKEINRLKQEEMKKQGGKNRLYSKITIEIPTGGKSNRCIIVPVGANWTEGRHIVGYKNAITGKYTSTPCLEIIRSAKNDPSCPYLLILDEMNLSHVERYFSDILSAMESKKPINLDGEESLSIEDNLIIVGTVNQDETTYSFSPKVLDRANVIEFHPPDINTIFSNSEEEEPHGNVAFLENGDNYHKTRSLNAATAANEISSFAGNTKFISMIKSDLAIIQKHMDSMGFAFGFRTVDEVMRFMYASWVYEGSVEFTNWKRYFDAQIVQKILPKIHGNLSIRDPLNNLKTFCESEGFNTSTRKLTHMLSILDNQRYVSFNC